MTRDIEQIERDVNLVIAKITALGDELATCSSLKLTSQWGLDRLREHNMLVVQRNRLWAERRQWYHGS